MAMFNSYVKLPEGTVSSPLMHLESPAETRIWTEDGVSPIAEDYADVTVVFTDPRPQFGRDMTWPNAIGLP